MLTEKIEPIYNFDNFVKIAKNTLQRAHKIAQNLVNKSKLANKAIYDKKCNPIDVTIGDLVLLRREPYKKHERLYDGPHKITEVRDKNVIIEINDKTIEVHKNRIVGA